MTLGHVATNFVNGVFISTLARAAGLHAWAIIGCLAFSVLLMVAFSATRGDS